MLDIRMPAAPPPRPRTAPHRREQARPRSSSAAALPRPITSSPAAVPLRPRRTRSAAQSRIARSETRMMAMNVGGATLLCLALVVYLAAYAHVTWLGLQQSEARSQLTIDLRQNHLLQMQLADLQNPARVVAAAKNQKMALYVSKPTYITVNPQGQASVFGQPAEDTNAAKIVVAAATVGH